MRRHRKVVWSEGMFIAPQHFQQQERYNHHHLEQYVSLTQGGHKYGLATLEIDQHRLQIGKIAVTQCRGLFPDGTYFESTRELLLDVKQGALEKCVYLALPMTIEGENEYGQREENKRYLKESVNLFDASDSGQNSVETTVAEPNVRLLLEGDETAGMTLIPVAKILESRESGQLVLDQSYIPACIQYGASSLLKERVKELLVLTQTRANSVVQRIGAGQNRKSEQSLMREYLWLQTLIAGYLGCI
ncbi:type VI secretion system baseplate subunit TssK [Marinomonas sp. MED121]|uniref:type VI secretion system baseplate subunit TssK n=1 Tax=Marinomonas sp. MED121 TaxID=314277 RepID=UPI003241EC90